METDFRLIENHKKAISQRFSSSGEKRKTVLEILREQNSVTIGNLRRALYWAFDDEEKREIQKELDSLLSKAKNKNNESQAVDLENPTIKLVFDRMPNRPYCTDNLQSGLKIRPKIVAIQKKYVQHNPPALLGCLAFDLDYDIQLDNPPWEKAGVKRPNILIFNRKNGHAHALYLLKDPVCTTEYAHRKPIRYATAILGAYGSALEADPGYAGLIIKNPAHSFWRTEVIRADLYELRELADRVDLRKSEHKQNLDQGLGRNVWIFEEARFWAYREVRRYWRPGGYSSWAKAVLAYVEMLNRQCSPPLPYSEVKSIGKSISKWTWSHITPSEFQDVQSRRGRRGGLASGEARREALSDRIQEARRMRDERMSRKDIARLLGVSEKTVTRWCSK